MTSKKQKSKKKSMPSRQKKNNEKKSLIIYYVGVIAFAFLYQIISNQEWFLSSARPIFEGYAQISSFVINIFGEDSMAHDIVISSRHFSLSIEEGCDAITPMILYSMAILAFPISFRLKWPGIVLGIPALLILNVVRIISLYYIGKHFSYGVFNFMHVTFWQILFLIFTVFIWLLWMRWAYTKKAESANP